MKLYAYLVACFYFCLPGGAIAQTPQELQGHWVCQGAHCGCRPSSPDKYTQIKLTNGTLSLENECGDVSGAALQTNSRLFAQGWNVSGTISADRRTISWDNSSVWTRVANVSELEQRLAYWEGQVFYCNYDPRPGTKFPSKETSDRKDCDDGDPYSKTLCSALQEMPAGVTRCGGPRIRMAGGGGRRVRPRLNPQNHHLPTTTAKLHSAMIMRSAYGHTSQPQTMWMRLKSG